MTHTPSADTLNAGQRIGPYVLLVPLGAGGSGRVWAAARLGQLGFSKRLVLKVMRSDRLGSGSARERFEREACLGARLSHPNLRAVHDLGSHEGRPYMALAWVDTSLAELLEHAPSRRLPPAVACWVGMQCCAGLGAAHAGVELGGRARPIVHRDVSPGNILLGADGHALLADLAAPASELDARPGAEGGRAPFFGNLAYAAPEALRQEDLDGRADVYSLGCVLFESLAGVPAFDGDDERSVMFQILERGAPALGERAPGVPPELARVVERCLRRRREERFQDAAELASALSACAAERTAFSLERETAALIQSVVGERIRARERTMHGALQQVSPSALERTDTLPLADARALDGTARTSIPAGLSRSAAGVALSRSSPPRARRRRWLALPVLLVLPLGLSLYARARHAPPQRAAGDGLPAPATAAPVPSSAAPREALSSEAAPRAARSPALTPEPAQPAPAAARAAAPARPSAGGASSQSGPAPPRPAPPRPAPPRPARPRPAPPRPAPPAAVPGDADPFADLRLERNPYEERARRRAEPPAPAAAERAAPRQNAPRTPTDMPPRP